MSKVDGSVVYVAPVKQVTDKFRKREVVIKSNDEKYPQFISFELSNDNCSKADGLSTGQAVSIEYNLRGRAWTAPDGTTKYFNTVEAWNITTTATNTKTPTPDVTDDLPF